MALIRLLFWHTFNKLSMAITHSSQKLPSSPADNSGTNKPRKAPFNLLISVIIRCVFFPQIIIKVKDAVLPTMEG